MNTIKGAYLIDLEPTSRKHFTNIAWKSESEHNERRLFKKTYYGMEIQFLFSFTILKCFKSQLSWYLVMAPIWKTTSTNKQIHSHTKIICIHTEKYTDSLWRNNNMNTAVFWAVASTDPNSITPRKAKIT